MTSTNTTVAIAGIGRSELETRVRVLESDIARFQSELGAARRELEAERKDSLAAAESTMRIIRERDAMLSTLGTTQAGSGVGEGERRDRQADRVHLPAPLVLEPRCFLLGSDRVPSGGVRER